MSGTLAAGALRWRCRRGMKELDLLFERYLERHWPSAAAEERAAFERLLQAQDPLIYGYCLGSTPVPDHLFALIERITSHVGVER